MRPSETFHSSRATSGSIAHCFTPWLFANSSAHQARVYDYLLGGYFL
jgi:hypothetical protein